MKLIENLNWRYATKSFNSAKKVAPNQIRLLKEATRLSASSYGLQLYKVLVIENPELREELKRVSYNQSQITEASHLFVFCACSETYDQEIDDYFQLLFNLPGAEADQLTAYWQSTKSQISNMAKPDRNTWMEKQCYLAMSTLLIACADLKIDACPMEGFHRAEYDRILGLKEQGLSSVVIVPVGYRSEKDLTQHRKKVRRPEEKLFISIR